MAAAAVATAAAAAVSGAPPPTMAAPGAPPPPPGSSGGPAGLGDRLRAARQEAFADAMDTGMDTYEAAVAGRKGDLLREAFRVAAATAGGASVADAMATHGGPAGTGSGGGDGEAPAVRVLDVGIGTAPNVGYYPPCAVVTGVDPSAAMTARAATNTRRRRPDVRLVTVPSVAAATTAAAGAPYDVAICTLTLCSVDDPTAVVAAAAAALRPGGVFVYVEHVGARPADGGASPPAVAAAVGLRVLQTLAYPAQMALADGCHLTRDAEGAVRAAAPWAAVTAERFRVPGGGALLISPHVAGLAVKAM